MEMGYCETDFPSSTYQAGENVGKVFVSIIVIYYLEYIIYCYILFIIFNNNCFI